VSSPLAQPKQAPQVQAPTAATSRPSEPARPPNFPGGGANSLLSNAAQSNGSTSSPRVVQAQPQVSAQTPPDRYTTIHKNLKELRKSMVEQAKTNRALKERMGDMRREIRKSVGQLTGGVPGVNRQQVCR
jgi:nucleoporin GLE1